MTSVSSSSSSTALPEADAEAAKQVRELLIEHFPDLRFPSSAYGFCQDFETPLAELPIFCSDARISRFLRAAQNDVRVAFDKLRNSLEIELSSRREQSPAVEAALASRRFRYVGTTRQGLVVFGVDCMWGNLLEVDGGLETILQAFTVFYFRLPSIIERDIGRKALLKSPSYASLFVGGSPPISFVRAGLLFFEEHWPGGLAMSVAFETNSFKSVIARNTFNFLPKGNGTDYHWTNTRSRLLELLDIEDYYVSDNDLYLDVPHTVQLSSTAAIDREWQDVVKSAEKQGIQDALQIDQQHASVKNTFVELVAGSGGYSRRGRALSDSDLVGEDGASKKLLDEVDSRPCRQPLATGALPEATGTSSDTEEQPGCQQQPLAEKKGKKPRLSGWTRGRRNRAKQKQKDMEEKERQAGEHGDLDEDGFKSPRSQ